MSISDEYMAVNAAIAKAAAEAGRDPTEISLTAVSKTFPADQIRPLLELGHRVFGENRVQEAMSKWPHLREAFADVVLHLIGPLQTNKAADAVSHFDVIEVVDREKLVRHLNAEMEKQDRWPLCFVQVNTGLEAQKAGIDPREVADFVEFVRTETRLRLVGLMAIPPQEEPPAPHFALLHKLAEQAELPRLSMGMSADYPTAVHLGATDVRVGSALFGPRD